MCRHCSNKTDHLQQQLPLKAERSLQWMWACKASCDDFCQIKKKRTFPSNCWRRCDGRRDKQRWLWIGLVSSHLWACRCWFTASDHTELTGGNRPSLLLLSLILLSFLCLPYRSNASGHTSIPSLCNTRYIDSVIMRDKRVQGDVSWASMCTEK